MWGKGAHRTQSVFAKGITPTCVGKREARATLIDIIKDHPHVCGEKKVTEAITSPLRGSPPRVWGKVTGLALLCLIVWITPTCVGKREARATLIDIIKDHPHVCGEKRADILRSPNPGGSPPRVWGKVSKRTIIHGLRGITPTCVGKRSHNSAFLLDARDHPHVCGEKLQS